MVGESFHHSGCRGEDDDHIRLGATVQSRRAFSHFTLKDSFVQSFDEGWSLVGLNRRDQVAVRSALPPQRRIDLAQHPPN